MNAPTHASALQRCASPFDLADDASYQRWRARRLAQRARSVDELLVDVADPAALTAPERSALLQRLAGNNLVLYRCRAQGDGRAAVLALGRQLGLQQLDANWLAEEDGLSPITVSDARDGEGGRGGFIPYTDRAIRWHTDGYYHPDDRRIRSMILHCVRPAAEGGENTLLDHELAYIALRDASVHHVRALMAPDAMTIPERRDDAGVARPAQSGPVFSVDPADGTLHMRYTARTRSIEWKADEATRAAVDCLAQVLAGGDAGCSEPGGAACSDTCAPLLRLRLDAGMGLVAHNVLHDRSAFRDDPARPRLLYRARYRDRTAFPS